MRAIEEGHFEHRRFGRIGEGVTTASGEARGIDHVAEQATHLVGLLQLVGGVGVILRLVDHTQVATVGDGAQHNGRTQIKVVVAAHIHLHGHLGAHRLQHINRPDPISSDVVVIDMEQRLAVAHGRAHAGIQGQHGVDVGFDGAGSSAAQAGGQTDEGTEVVVDDCLARQVDDVALGAGGDAGLLAVGNGLALELAELTDRIEVRQAADAIAVVGAEVGD